MSIVRVKEVVLLDIGHGNCCVLHDDCGTVVFDTGPGSILLEYLRAEQITNIDTVILSHADADHVGGLVGILASGAVTVGAVRFNSDAQKDSKAWDDLLYELGHRAHSCTCAIEKLSAPERIVRGVTHVEVCAPSAYLAGKGPGATHRHGGRITSNSISAVVRVVHGGKPVLLMTGDLDDVGLADLEHFRSEVWAPVLLFPHHGGSTGAGVSRTFVSRLLDLARPTVVLFSFGRKGRGSTKPDPEIVSAIRQSRPDIRVLCTQLSSHCAPEVPKSPALAHLLLRTAAGRNSNRCCAGTIVLPLDSPGVVLPHVEAHYAFVSNFAPSALCRR